MAVKKHIVIHPLLFAAFPVVSLFAHNIGQTYAREIIAPIAVTMGFALAAWGLLSLLLKDKDKAGLIVSLFLLLSFSYGHLAALMKDTDLVLPGSVLVLGRYQVLLFSWGILTVFLLLFRFLEHSASIGGDVALSLRGIVFGRQEVLLVIWGVVFTILLLPLVSGYSTGLMRNLVVVVGSSAIQPHHVLLITCISTFTLGACLCIRTRKNLRRLTTIMNISAVSVVIVSLLSIGSYVLRSGAVCGDHENAADISSHAADSGQTDMLRDIYYIILDRYGNEGTLQRVYGFDNSNFTDYLRGRGFYVATESKANYAKTEHSLASSLNMEYLNYLSEQMGEESHDWKPLYELMQDYEVWHRLKPKGYRFVNFGTWWGPTIRNEYADINVNLYSCGFTSEFWSELYKTTTFYPIGTEFGACDFYRDQWRRIRYKFDKLADISRMPEATFTFAHMLIPHHPYVFDKDGNFLTDEERKGRSEEVNYVEQLIFANTEVERLVDHLLSSSQIAPIVIVQADEGPYPTDYVLRGGNVDMSQATDAELRQRTGILNAYYLPQADTDVLYQSMTPVNSFRLVFNLYFETNFEMLPDRSYVVQDWGHPYKLIDVTDRVN